MISLYWCFVFIVYLFGVLCYCVVDVWCRFIGVLLFVCVVLFVCCSYCFVCVGLLVVCCRIVKGLIDFVVLVLCLVWCIVGVCLYWRVFIILLVALLA